MIVYRLAKEKYRNDLSGMGAHKYGGRWNSKGRLMVYCGETRALCATEIAVHTPYGNIPDHYFMTRIFIPDECITNLNVKELPANWNHFPHQQSTQKIGDAFMAAAKHLVLNVPSATVQGEHNFLINPLHKDIRKVIIEQHEPFTFDSRLFTRA